jgi:hypothetical protein
MSLCRPERDKVPMTCWGLVLNPRWIRDLDRNNVPCLKSTLILPCLIPRYCGLYQDDKGGNEAGKQGGEKGLMRATVSKGKQELGNVTWRPEEGHLTPEVKTSNEMTCDYVWDKLHHPPPSISVTCSKWYIRKAPFALRAQPLDLSLLSCCSLLNKLAS